jgi:hypothetical protein
LKTERIFNRFLLAINIFDSHFKKVPYEFFCPSPVCLERERQYYRREKKKRREKKIEKEKKRFSR